MPIASQNNFTCVYASAAVREFDRRIIEEHRVPGFELMRKAAASAFASLRRYWPHARSVLVVCGPGNNGGDGFLVGELAINAGLDVTLVSLANHDKIEGDAAQALQAFEHAGGRVEDFDDQAGLPEGMDIIVDALLGTGVSRPVEGRFHRVVTAINRAAQAGSGVLAVDIASGLDADTGKIWDVAVRADITATFIATKLGLFTGAGPAYSGAVEFYDLGAPAEVYQNIPPAARVVDANNARQALVPRLNDAHKGAHGHVLCVGGNHGMGGAIRLAGEAALRVGAGLVSVATRGDHAAALSQARPEIMSRGVSGADDLDALIAAASVAAIGPGLGQDAWARALLSRLLDSKLPLVVDADALNLLAGEPLARGNWVLTPHPGEAARLLNCKTVDIQADRLAAVHELAQRYRAVVVLKGAGTLIKSPEGECGLCTAGNPGMAVGGMGDVLTGVVVGLLAQGLIPADAASVGTYIHASAGDAAAAAGGQRGLLPCDLFEYLRRAVNPS